MSPIDSPALVSVTLPDHRLVFLLVQYVTTIPVAGSTIAL
jgi:hypothetical protein